MSSLHLPKKSHLDGWEQGVEEDELRGQETHRSLAATSQQGALWERTALPF